MIYHKAIITLGNSSDWHILFDLKNDHVFDLLFASNVKNSVSMNPWSASRGDAIYCIYTGKLSQAMTLIICKAKVSLQISHQTQYKRNYIKQVFSEVLLYMVVWLVRKVLTFLSVLGTSPHIFDNTLVKS